MYSNNNTNTYVYRSSKIPWLEGGAPERSGPQDADDRKCAAVAVGRLL